MFSWAGPRGLTKPGTAGPRRPGPAPAGEVLGRAPSGAPSVLGARGRGGKMGGSSCSAAGLLRRPRGLLEALPPSEKHSVASEEALKGS